MNTDQTTNLPSGVEAVTYVPSEWDALPNEWGPYEGVAQIAQGGMGMVYRAVNKSLKRIEAIKVLRSGQFAGNSARIRFRFEAEAAAGLNHPNIVRIYGSGEVDSLPYFAMKWVEGGELGIHASECRSDPTKLARIMAKIARAVHHAHQLGILHRDLKPSNILLDSECEPHITDFGLAKRVDANDGLTQSGTVIGTPGYMAPEQARGESHLTTAVDVYGLGGILYFLLTDQSPFTGKTIPEVLHRVTHDAPAPPRSIDPTTNHDLEAICLKCLEKNPADRYPSAAAMAGDLERFARGESVSVRPPSVIEWFARELRKKPPQFPGYVWQVKIWFGVIMAISQGVIFAAVLAELSIYVVWGAFLFAWSASSAALQFTMAKKFTRLPETEQHSVMVALGHVFAHIALTLTMMPYSGTAAGALQIYPAMSAISGLAFFVIGTTHWGRFYWYGIGLMFLTPVLAVWPTAAPILYGVPVVAAMFHWAYAVKVTFGGSHGSPNC